MRRLLTLFSGISLLLCCTALAMWAVNRGEQWFFVYWTAGPSGRPVQNIFDLSLTTHWLPSRSEKHFTVWAYTRLAIPYWLVALAFGLLPVHWLKSVRRRRFRDDQGLCKRCGYDLRARRNAARNAASCRKGGCMSEMHVALLRRINVGGKNLLSMKDLIDVFTSAGCQDVRTFIQSGNVIFRAGAAKTARLTDVIRARIAERFGLQIRSVLRTAAQMRDVIRDNPFIEASPDPKTLHVLFLARRPEADRVANLDPNRSPPDTFAVRGSEIYLHLPNGVARSRLTNAWFDSKLSTFSTGRNWQTVTKLLDMMTSDER